MIIPRHRDSLLCRRIMIHVNRVTGKNYNHKRIRRLMHELGLRSHIRRPRHSCTIARGNAYEANVLDRDFTATKPDEKWCTDVTYLKFGNDSKAYLSAVKDLYTGEIVSYEVSRRNDNPLVMKTMRKAFETHPEAHPLIHTDRGFQYTSHDFAQLMNEHQITVVCRALVNVSTMPIESFWSHFRWKRTVSTCYL